MFWYTGMELIYRWWRHEGALRAAVGKFVFNFPWHPMARRRAAVFEARECQIDRV